MAINVYGWRKPTLELELVQGGSLLANTKYFVAGYMKYPPFVYNAVGGPLSDFYEITTTSTAKSIRITQKTYRSLLSFSNAGSNKTLVTSILHCLATGDQIKINSGTYTGTHIVTKVNKDTFTIPVAYVDNIPTQCYTDSTRYNHPSSDIGSYQNLGHCMTYFISTSDPRLNTTNWGANKWTSASHQYANNTNPTVITSQPGNAFMGQGNVQAREIFQGPFRSVEEYGTIYVRADGSLTLQMIYDAIIAEGFPVNCIYNYNQNHFLIVGTIQFTGGSINILGVNMTFVLGEFGYYTTMPGPSAYSNFQINSCLLNFIPRISQPYIYIAGNNNVFACNLGSNGISGVQNGVNNLYWATPLIVDTTTTYYFNFATMDLILANNITNKRYLNMGISSYIQASYGQQVWKSMYIPPIYYTLLNAAKDYEPTIYMMENVEIYKTQSTIWHFRFYQYPAQNGKYNKVKFLNINTDETSNVKKCITNVATNIEATFFRRIEIYIFDSDGYTIPSCTVQITNETGWKLVAVTDPSGYVWIDVKEQITIFTQSMGVISTWDGSKDVYFNRFTINISKPGYEDFNLSFVNAKNFALFKISLNPIKPIVFSHLEINCNKIDDPEITAQVNNNELKGDLINSQEIVIKTQSITKITTS